MGKVVLELTMSLDGFVAGPDISATQPLGKDGLQLHHWLFEGKTDVDTQLLDEVVQTSGAVIVGARTYLTGIEEGWGGKTPFIVPAFVVINQVPEKQVDGFVYVTDGIERALAQAQATAGEKNVWIMGGAKTAQPYLRAGLVDELHIHIAPVLLAQGTRLFDDIGTAPIKLERISVVDTPGATHLRFRVVK